MRIRIIILALIALCAVTFSGEKVDSTVVTRNRQELIQMYQNRQKQIEEEHKSLSIQIQFMQSLADTTLRFKR